MKVFILKLLNNIYNLSFISIPFKEKYLYFFFRYFHIQFCRAFENCYHFFFQIEQYKFKFLKEPYGSKCIDYEKLNYNFSNTIDNEDIGLIECVKEKDPISLFFFTSNDTKPFIYFATNYASTPKLKELPKTETFRGCLKKFSRKDCGQSIHLNIQQKHVQKNYLNFTFKDRTVLIDENIFMTSLDFNLQVLGFISLIFGFSLNSSLSYINLYIDLHFNPKVKLSNLIFCLKYFLIFMVLTHMIIRTFQMTTDFKNQTMYQVTYFNYFFDHKTIKIYICFPLPLTVKLDDGLNATNKEPHELKLLTDILLKEYTLNDLIKKSVQPNELIERIFLTDGLKNTDVNVDEFSFQAFLMSNYEDDTSIYSKCFGYNIVMNLTSYQKLLKSTSLKIKFKVKYISFYFVSANQRVTEHDTQLYPTDKIFRYVFKRNQYECRDYHKVKFNNTICLTQQSAIDLCSIHKFVSEFKHLPLMVLHQERFKTYGQYKFTSKKGDVDQVKEIKDNHMLEFKKKCRKRFKEKNCEMVEYRANGKKVSVSKENNKISFDMFFLNQTYKPRDYNNLIAFISNVITLWSIFIDVSFASIFNLVLKLIKSRFKKDSNVVILNRNSPRSEEANKQRSDCSYLKLIKKSPIFILFSGSLVVILFDTFLTTPIQSISFDTKKIRYNFPTVGFCFDFTLNESERSYLTGHKLDQLTSHLNFTNFLDRVEYINNDSQNATWIVDQNELDENIYIDYFYYLDKKCFAFKYNLDIDSWDHLLIDYALRIHFKPNLTFDYIYYFTKAKQEDSFSQFHRLRQNHNLYSIKFECMRMIYIDILSKFKNPLILLTNKYSTQDAIYIFSLREWFEKATNLTTVYLPLRKNSFNLVINDDKFRDYYRTEIAPYEHYFHNVNHERVICKDFIVRTKNPNNRLAFFISKGMIRTLSKSESKVSYVSFFNSILNLLAFYYGLSVIATTLDFINALLKFLNKIKLNSVKKARIMNKKIKILIKKRINRVRKLR